jgi:eukaryotic-like serine/threonine-protein kinase
MESVSLVPAPGDRLGRYELLCALAQGGMGTVWLARFADAKLGIQRLLAVKTILASESDNAQSRDMFLDEARIAAEISHEGVAHILDIGEHRGILYFVMEYIDGESLRRLHQQVLHSGVEFPLPVALRICADACAGLHAAHELVSVDGVSRDVVHRDISPHNLLVTLRGTVKLIDFGVAKAKDRMSAETAFGTFKGKIGYMAPEQARSASVDRRADIYSLGAVLYELIAGKTVYDSSNGAQLSSLHALMTGAPYAPLSSRVPAPIREIVDVALSKRREERFPTAADFRSALEETMQSLRLSCESEDVARFVSIHCADRIRQRRELVELALRAAASRQAVAAPLTTPLDIQSSSADVGGQIPTSVSLEYPPTLAAVNSLLEPPSGMPRDVTWRRRRTIWAIAAMGGVLSLAAAVFAWGRGAPSRVASAARPDSFVDTPAAPPIPVPPPVASDPALAIPSSLPMPAIEPSDREAHPAPAHSANHTAPLRAPKRATAKPSDDDYGF